MINYEKDISGSMVILPEHEKELIMEIIANFHLRNGVKHSEDESLGEIRITPVQLANCLAWCLSRKSKQSCALS